MSRILVLITAAFVCLAPWHAASAQKKSSGTFTDLQWLYMDDDGKILPAAKAEPDATVFARARCNGLPDGSEVTIVIIRTDAKGRMPGWIAQWKEMRDSKLFRRHAPWNAPALCADADEAVTRKGLPEGGHFFI